MSDEERYLKPSEVSKRLGVSRAWVSKNKHLFDVVTLKTSKVSNRVIYRISPSSVDDYIQKNTKKTDV